MKTLTVSAVLFDFDGTLVDSIDSAYAAVCKMYRMDGLTPPTRDEFHDQFEPPWIPSFQKFGLLRSSEEIWELYERFAGHAHRTAPFYSDVRDTLLHFVLSGISTGLISSQKTDIVERRCREDDLHRAFTHIAGGCDDKAKAISEFCELFGHRPKSVAYVGDFGIDMRDAKRAGCVAIGITRESVSEYVFRKSGADHTVAHLKDLHFLTR